MVSLPIISAAPDIVHEDFVLECGVGKGAAMSMEQAEWAIQSLYENVSARDELSDSEAQLLLNWGEAQIMRLAEKELPQAEFELAFDNLSGLIRRLNRLAARRGRLTLEDQTLAINRILESALAIGLDISPQALEAFLNQPSSQAAAGDVYHNVQSLIGLMGEDKPDNHDEEPYDEQEP